MQDPLAMPRWQGTVRMLEIAPGKPWESTGGKAMHQERPECSLASKGNSEKTRAVNLLMENSVTQCLDQHWKPAFGFGV